MGVEGEGRSGPAVVPSHQLTKLDAAVGAGVAQVVRHPADDAALIGGVNELGALHAGVG